MNWLSDFWDEHWPAFAMGALAALCVVLLVVVAKSETAFEQDLLSRARTFQDTLAVQQIMAQRRTADAISFGAGLVAGSNAASASSR